MYKRAKMAHQIRYADSKHAYEKRFNIVHH